jgi:hypothetical protein
MQTECLTLSLLSHHPLGLEVFTQNATTFLQKPQGERKFQTFAIATCLLYDAMR